MNLLVTPHKVKITNKNEDNVLKVILFISCVPSFELIQQLL